ncbi:MAG: sodium:proton exchanger [Sphingomonadales bacterium]|nr:sodium:proton exchanger [Sphingomonadales bacterium]
MEGEAAAAAAATHSLLYEGVLLLGAALVFVIIFRKFGLGAVLGYLCAGALIGPQGLALVGDGESKMAIAEIGIVLLLFLVGLELNPARLWRLRRDIFGFGFAQVLVCGLMLFAVIYIATGFTWAAALALGLPLALSSTAQVLPGLKSSGRINSPFGERAFSILLFQDLSIVPLITIIAALSRAPADPSAPPGWMLAVYTLGAIVGLVLVGRFVLNPLLKLVGRLGERELFVVVGLFTVLASAAVMQALHLSTALGAFIAGVMLADSPYRHEIESDVEPFRSILLGLFFLAVGMVLDIDAILANPVTVVGMAAAVVIVKTGVIFGLARLWKVDSKPALGLALLLSQGGEFGFVLFAQARDALLIENEAASLFGAVVTLSMASTPFLMMIARRLEFAAPDKGENLDGPDDAPGTTAIVVGHGRFGQTVAQMLAAVDCSVTLIDKKPRQIELSGEFDTKVYFGDGLRLDLLRRAGAEQAAIIALCIDDKNLNRAAVADIAEAFPDARLLVRVFDRRQLIAIEQAGHCAAVREVYESSICMGRLALEAIEIAEEEIADVEQAFRHNDQTRLEMQIEAGDLHAGSEHRFKTAS